MFVHLKDTLNESPELIGDFLNQLRDVISDAAETSIMLGLL